MLALLAAADTSTQRVQELEAAAEGVYELEMQRDALQEQLPELLQVRDSY